MAMEVQTVMIERIRSDRNGNLVLSGVSARYTVRDSAKPRMTVGGHIELNDINPSLTVQQWFDDVKAQILTKDAADEVAFNAAAIE